LGIVIGILQYPKCKPIIITGKYSLEIKIFYHSTPVVCRTEFISKLTLLKEQWQNVIWLVQQRKKDIDGLVSQWQLFRGSLRSLSRFLADTNSFLTAVKSQDCYSLYHLRNLIHDFKVLYLFLINLKSVIFLRLKLPSSKKKKL